MTKLVEFHTCHKLPILSYSTELYRELGRIVANPTRSPTHEVYEKYEERMLAAITLKATAAKHTNVLQHLMGYYKKHLTSDEKRELIEIIKRFRSGFLPLIVPITLINQYVKKYGEGYLAEQVYLNPHPMELKLRNHAKKFYMNFKFNNGMANNRILPFSERAPGDPHERKIIK